MVPRSMQRNDNIEFNLGSRVLIRPYIDSNDQTRVSSLYEHLNTKVYLVCTIINFNKVKLVAEEDSQEFINEIDIIRLRKIGE